MKFATVQVQTCTVEDELASLVEQRLVLVRYFDRYFVHQWREINRTRTVLLSVYRQDGWTKRQFVVH